MKKHPIGTRFGKLILLERWYVDGVGYMRCLCDCGNEKVFRASNIYGKSSKSCGCGFREACRLREYKKNHPTHNVMLSYYKRNAKIRQLSWELSNDEFTELINKKCTYCDAPPVERILSGKSISYNGIDRVDNSLGYFKDNVVTCCQWCNWAKNKMSKDQFILWIDKVYNHLKTSGQL